MAIAGGVNLSTHPAKYVTLSEGQLIGSRPESRSFAAGDGYLPSEAVGAVLLKPLSHAIAEKDNILAVIKGSTVNHNGRSNGYSVPNPNTQAQLIEHVLQSVELTLEPSVMWRLRQRGLLSAILWNWPLSIRHLRSPRRIGSSALSDR